MSSGIGCQDVFNPVEELTHFDIDSGVVRLGTSLTPGHQAVDLSNTHQGAAGVTLTNTEGVSVSRYAVIHSSAHTEP